MQQTGFLTQTEPDPPGAELGCEEEPRDAKVDLLQLNILLPDRMILFLVFDSPGSRNSSVTARKKRSRGSVNESETGSPLPR